MDFTILALLGIALYIALMIGIGWATGRGQSQDDYIIGGRNVGLIATAASIGAGWRDIAFIGFWISFAFINGWAMAVNFIGAIASLILIGYLARRFHDQGRERNHITAGDVVRAQIGPYTHKAYISIVIFIALIYGAAQLFVLGSIFAHVFDIPPIVTIPVIALTVGFYLWCGGYGSVIITDLIQYAIICLIILTPFILLGFEGPDGPLMHDGLHDISSLFSLNIWEMIALIILPFMWNAPAADLWQRILSARSASVMRNALCLGSLAVVLLSGTLVIIGITLQPILPAATPETLYLDIFTSNILPAWLLTGLLIAMFAMGMSTLDTYSYVFTSMVIRDLRPRHQRADAKSYKIATRRYTLLYLSGLTLVALSYDDLISTLMGLVSVYAIGAPVFWLILTRLPLKQDPATDYGVAGIAVFSVGVFLYMHFADLFGTSFVNSLIPVGIGLVLSFIWAGYRRLSHRS